MKITKFKNRSLNLKSPQFIIHRIRIKFRKKKRKRKKKSEVERKFKCLMTTCNKSYGSENSLNQHIKLKHKEFWANMKNKQMHMNMAETIYFDRDKGKSPNAKEIL